MKNNENCQQISSRESATSEYKSRGHCGRQPEDGPRPQPLHPGSGTEIKGNKMASGRPMKKKLANERKQERHPTATSSRRH